MKIHKLPEASEAANDDVLVIDSPTNGARRISASNLNTGGSAFVQSFEIWNAADGTYFIGDALGFAIDIDDLVVVTTAGTCNVAMKIDGVDVGGMDAIPATTTRQVVSASGTNAAGTDALIELVISAAASLGNLRITLRGTLT